jgi:Kef-type K+ transport system membrane component KefB
MSESDLLRRLQRSGAQFRLIAASFSLFSLGFLAVSVVVAQQRDPVPHLFSLIYPGIIIAAVQLPLSFYLWSYIPRRMPRKLSEAAVVASFRMAQIVVMLLCSGVVVYAGLSAVLSGYAHPGAVIGGIALGTMTAHFPNEAKYISFLRNMRE